MAAVVKSYWIIFSTFVSITSSTVHPLVVAVQPWCRLRVLLAALTSLCNLQQPSQALFDLQVFFAKVFFAKVNFALQVTKTVPLHAPRRLTTKHTEVSSRNVHLARHETCTHFLHRDLTLQSPLGSARRLGPEDEQRSLDLT